MIHHVPAPEMHATETTDPGCVIVGRDMPRDVRVEHADQTTSLDSKVLELLRTALERQVTATEKLGVDVVVAIKDLRADMTSSVAVAHRQAIRTILFVSLVGWGLIAALVGVSLTLDKQGAVITGARQPDSPPAAESPRSE